MFAGVWTSYFYDARIADYLYFIIFTLVRLVSTDTWRRCTAKIFPLVQQSVSFNEVLTNSIIFSYCPVVLKIILASFRCEYID